MAEFTDVMKKVNEICERFDCTECPLNRYDCACMSYGQAIEYEAMVMNWKEDFDWAKVAVDTPIFVKYEETDEWLPRYFAKYEKGYVFAYRDGCTSWSSNGKEPSMWFHAKLANIK